MEKFLLIKTDGTVETVEYDEKQDKLDFWYDAIGCSCVDIVNAYGIDNVVSRSEDFKKYAELYCLIADDEGLFAKNPQINHMASLMYGVREHGQPLVGNILVAKNLQTDDGLETVGLNEEDINFLKVYMFMS